MSETYPHSPGYKDNDTSREAAEDMEARAPRLRAAALYALACRGPMTADEIASVLGESVLAVRPRISELYKTGYIIKTDLPPRKNRSGKNARVWAIKVFTCNHTVT